MALRDLLVCVANDPACSSRVDVAIGLAAAHDAHLTGLHVSAMRHLPGYVEVEIPPEFRNLQARRHREEVEQAERLFAERARRGGVRFEWRAVEGAIAADATLHARYADVTIVGQGIDLGPVPAEMVTLPEDLALAVGRPVLVVPRYGTFPTVGQRVLVGWNRSREATRAVNDAIPILARATQVTVLSVDPEDEPESREPGADLALHLARHHVRVTAAQVRGAAIEVGDVLLSYAADMAADLIVMGAYGHSRLREMVLGGVTRHLLRHMTVPVLLSH